MELSEAFSDAPYPGRGLVVCRTEEGLTLAYWLTGRSPASQHRALVARGDELSAVDLGGADDDPLRHYRCALATAGHVLLGNGDHIDDLAERTGSGASAFEALTHQRPEPDPPIRTARLATVIDAKSGAILVGAARAVPGDPGFDHVATTAPAVPHGSGLFITTYRGAPEQPTTWATPTWVTTPATTAALAEQIWRSLDARYRVALAVRTIGGGDWAIHNERRPA